MLFDIYDERIETRKRFVVKGAIPPANLTHEKAVHDVSSVASPAGPVDKFSNFSTRFSSCYEQSTLFAGIGCAESCCPPGPRLVLSCSTGSTEMLAYYSWSF